MGNLNRGGAIVARIVSATLPFLGASQRAAVAEALRGPATAVAREKILAPLKAALGRLAPRKTYFKRKPEYWAAVNAMTNWQNTQWMRAGGIVEHAERYANLERPSR